MPITDYESWAFAGTQTAATQSVNPAPLESLFEGFRGTEIVSWWGSIERQVIDMLEKNEASKNYPYAAKLRQFLTTWRDNEITGSINREQLDTLKSTAAQLSVDDWKYGNYFSNLRDQLRKLIASEEELPRVEPEPADKKGGKKGSIPGVDAPPSEDFGSATEGPSAVNGENAAPGSGSTGSAGGASNV